MITKPTLCTPELIAKAWEYVKTCEEKIKTEIPSIESLADYVDTHRANLYEWEGKHKEISDILEQVRRKQAKYLINKGLLGEYNSTITKVMLTKHGYREGHEHTGADGGPVELLTGEDLKDRMKQLKKK